MAKKAAKKYLRDFLKVAPLSHALWRSAEAVSFSKVTFDPPVLDLGCGFGEFAGVVFNKIEMGIDVEQKDLDEAVRGKKYKNTKWADARQLPFRGRSYKTVVSVSVLEHIDEAEKVIVEAQRVLKKNGIFVFSVVTSDIKKNLVLARTLKLLGLNNLADKYIDLHCRAFNHTNLKSSAWWTKQLEKANFKILKKEGTISPTLLGLHELFLTTAFPSQFWKLFFGKRMIMSVGLRSSILPIFFSRFAVPDRSSTINMFFVAQKV